MLYFWINTHFSTSQQKPHSHLNCLIIFPVAVCHLDFLPYGLHSFIFSWHHPSWIEIKKLSHGWLFIFVMSSARMTNSLHCIGCCIKLLSRQRRDKNKLTDKSKKFGLRMVPKGFILCTVAVLGQTQTQTSEALNRSKEMFFCSFFHHLVTPQIYLGTRLGSLASTRQCVRSFHVQISSNSTSMKHAKS